MANNKLREALVKAQTALMICEWPDGTRMEGVAELMRQIDAALAEPERNCDVGTADEQQARHIEWCHKHGIDGDNEVNCAHPDLDCDLCALRWMQMPYETNGGNK